MIEAMFEGIVFHGHLMERKVMINRQFSLLILSRIQCRHVTAATNTTETLGSVAAPTSRPIISRQRRARCLIADQTHCVLPIDQHLAEVVQEDHLVDKWLRQGATSVTLAHSLQQILIGSDLGSQMAVLVATADVHSSFQLHHFELFLPCLG